MKKQIFGKIGLYSIILLLCAVLYCNGGYITYILAYAFMFVFFLCYIVFTHSSLRKKLAQGLVYALILAAQVLIAVFLIRPAENDTGANLCRFLGTILLLAPLPVNQVFFQQE